MLAYPEISLTEKREQSLILKTRLLETIAEAVELFLFNENWEYALKDCLELMGKAVDVDRVYFFENFNDPKTDKLYTRQIMEWVKEGISSEIDNQLSGHRFRRPSYFFGLFFEK